jgi:hypothetical protein
MPHQQFSHRRHVPDRVDEAIARVKQILSE